MLRLIFLLIFLIVCVNSATVSIIEVPHSSPAQENILNNQNPNSINEVENNDQFNICTTEICQKESVKMHNFMDESVDPCENFYEFACGKFIRDTVLSEDKDIEISVTQVQDKVDEQLRSILTEELQPNEPTPFMLAKTFTKTCLDQVSLNEKGITPMVDILEQYGGWPVVKGDNWNFEDWDWLEANKKILKDGLPDDLILECRIRTDFMNSSKRVVQIDRGGYGMMRKFLTKGIYHPHVNAYHEFMVDAAVIFGANRTIAENELLDALRFEMELAKINIVSQYNPFTIRKLQSTYPYINWLDYINWNLNDYVHVNESEIVIVWDRNYLLHLNGILQMTPKRTIANYFAWRLVFFSSGLMNDVLHKRYQQFVAITTGRMKSLPRLTECVKRTMAFLPIATGATYVRKYFNDDSKRAVIDLVRRLHDEFLNTLHRVSWMDEKTRAAAIAKANAMFFHIAYPDELVDDNKLEEFYNGLELQSDSLLHSLLRIRQFNNDRLINQLRNRINKTDWETHSMISTVNAFFSHTENSIRLPAAALQEPFFSTDRPSYLNFGGIGWFIAHEMTHGFDDKGRQFDLYGNLVNWWQENTLKEFTSKTECFIRQYSNYTDPILNLTVNGMNTQGENVADNGAIKVVYSAYQNYIQQNGPDLALAGLNYTINQLFWISAAQTLCAVTRPDFDIMQYMTNVHTPFKYRLIGAFSNSYNFSKDFNCMPGLSKMNPINKCEIW